MRTLFILKNNGEINTIKGVISVVGLDYRGNLFYVESDDDCYIGDDGNLECDEKCEHDVKDSYLIDVEEMFGDIEMDIYEIVPKWWKKYRENKIIEDVDKRIEEVQKSINHHSNELLKLNNKKKELDYIKEFGIYNDYKIGE